MSDTHWLTITNTCSTIGVVTTLFANCTLLTLLYFRPSKAMGNYKYLMAIFSIFSMFYTGIETILRPIMHAYDSTVFVIQRKRWDYSSTWARAISSTYCGCYSMSFILFAIHFIYRFFVTCKPHLMYYFNGSRSIIWFVVAAIGAGSWGTCVFVLYPETERSHAKLLYVLETSYELDPAHVGCVPYTYFVTGPDGEDIANYKNTIGVIQHYIVMGLSFSAVFYCGIVTHLNIKKHKRMGVSDRTRDLQAQLFRALVLQTLIPMIFMYIPITLLFIMPFFKINIGAWANVTTSTVHLYPGIDPLVLLFLIKDYRRTLLTVFRGVKVSRSEMSSFSVQPTKSKVTI